MSFFVSLQKILPQHGLSRVTGWAAQQRQQWISRPFIHTFAKAYDVNMDEALESDLDAYDSFNAFFTRPLREGARPLPEDPLAIACPADGAISELGTIEQGRLLQAKGMRYSLEALAGRLGKGLDGGQFCTVYLAPSDYHRVHMPLAGTLTDSLAMPGALFSVNTVTTEGVEGLFCRNERLVCRFETAAGPMLVVLVGAMIVASIETVFDSPPSPYRIERHSKHEQVFERGDELGRFLLGSTAIVCLPPGAGHWDTTCIPGTTVRMGQAIGTLTG